MDARDFFRGLRPAAQRVFSILLEREAVAGNSPRLATHFSLLRQRKVSKRKAPPLSASLRFATGNLSCDGWAGNRSNSAIASDNRGSFSRPTVTTQAHTEGVGDSLLVALCATLHSRCNARQRRASSAAPCAVVRRRVAQGWADQGSRLFEAIAEFERDPAQTEQRSVPEALLRDDAFGSPFLCLLSFGEAKESEWPPGHPRPAIATKSNNGHKQRMDFHYRGSQQG